jgi:hypothetical protein
VTVRPGYTGDAEAAHLHRARLDGVIITRGIARTRIARTILDIAREHDIEDAVVVGDAALARRMVDGERLVRAAEFCAGWPGIRRAYGTLQLLDPRSESPLESVSRVRLAWAGVPKPEPQVEIVDRTGLWLGRLDFYWDEFGVAGEVDGKVKYRTDPGLAFHLEKRRQELMEDTGLVFVRWGRADLDDMPRLASRLSAGFRRGSRLPRSERGWIVRSSGLLAPEMHAPWAS